MLKLFWISSSIILIVIGIFQTPKEILGLSEKPKRSRRILKVLTAFVILLYFGLVLIYDLRLERIF